MKKLAVTVIVFIAAAVGCAVWFSPLARGSAIYDDNMPTESVVGLCYNENALVRADFETAEQMFDALDKILAREIARAESGGTTVIYAFSERVCVKPLRLSTGEEYNVMAAYSDGGACIGMPVLSGSY